jgi:hypothetical protein
MRGKLLVALSVLLLFAAMSVVENRAVSSKPTDPADNVSSVYKLAGEFRTVFANLLWIKADAYHHEFIEHNPHWCENKDLLGMMKIITALDPRFVEAYSTGSYILMYGYHDAPKSLAYLHEGIAVNPKSRELNQLAAILYAQKLRDPVRALPYAQRAARYAEDDWNRDLTTRLLRSVRRMIREKSAKGQS